jgi:hypothetical protein
MTKNILCFYQSDIRISNPSLLPPSFVDELKILKIISVFLQSILPKNVIHLPYGFVQGKADRCHWIVN